MAFVLLDSTDSGSEGEWYCTVYWCSRGMVFAFGIPSGRIGIQARPMQDD
jgi:hypothetical protein